MRKFIERDRKLLVGDTRVVVQSECKCDICGKEIRYEDNISIQRQMTTISGGLAFHVDPASEHTHLDICEECEKKIISHLRGVIGAEGLGLL